MLTVMKDAARAAGGAVEGGDADLRAVVGAARQEAHDSVRRTPELLPVLREAGVVDAGGLGVAVILDGLYACVTGQEIEVPDDRGVTPDLEAIHAQEEAWGYCTEFLVDGFDGDAAEFEERIYDSGRSVFVVDDDDVVKVHLHTQDPGAALSYAGGFGRLAGVKVDDMEAQVRSRGKGSGEVAPARLGVVAASRGAGNRDFFEQMGAVVIAGGQGENPSAADLARAVEKTGAHAVVLLPNNKNIVPTAEQVGELVEAKTHVVPTTSIAAGLAVMVGYDAEGDPEEVVEEMGEIAASLRAAEVTRSVRNARIGDREVPEGAYMGFLSGELIAVEETARGSALVLARKMVGEGADLLTLLKGEDLEEEDLEAVLEGIRTPRRRPRGRGQRRRAAAVSVADGGRVTTAIVTDSTTSLAPGVLERPDLRMVPLTFHFGPEETYTDKVDMSNAEFYERLRDSDVFPTTAQPAPGAFVEGLRGALRLRRHPGAHALQRVQRHL